MKLIEFKGSEGFDEGIDFIINNKRVDRKKPWSGTEFIRSHFIGDNFIGYQMKYDTDYYIYQVLQ